MSCVDPPKLLPHPGVVVGSVVVRSVAGVMIGGVKVGLPGSIGPGSTGSPDVLQIPPISIPGVL